MLREMHKYYAGTELYVLQTKRKQLHLLRENMC